MKRKGSSIILICILILLLAGCAGGKADSCVSNNKNEQLGIKQEKEKKEEAMKVKYEVMLKRSLISTGNNSRIKNIIKKAQNGEKITIAYIGGSITEGAKATKNEDTYASLSHQSFKKLYGKGTGENVKFLNAGMSGTPSTLGMIRYERDVVGRGGSKPDIVFVEFAVNDADDPTNGDAYESLVLDILKQDNKPAVVLLFSVFKSRWNLQNRMIPIGEYYELPMISIKDALVPELDSKEGLITEDEYFSDSYHPTDKGHKIMADCITHFFKTVNDEKEKKSDITIQNTPKIGNTFVGIKMLDSLSKLEGIKVEKGSFNMKDSSLATFIYDTSTQTFPNNWRHTGESGNDSFLLNLQCKNLVIIYKKSNSDKAGTAEVLVDGKIVTSINSYDKGGWNNPFSKVIINEKTVQNHKVEVKMQNGDENKDFTILAFGYTK